MKKISPQEALRRGDYDIDTSDLDLVQEATADDAFESRINSFLNAE